VLHVHSPHTLFTNAAFVGHIGIKPHIRSVIAGTDILLLTLSPTQKKTSPTKRFVGDVSPLASSTFVVYAINGRQHY